MTNYERIKAMGVEEMVELLQGDCRHCVFFWKECIGCPKTLCDEGVLKWLNSEVGE